jgi:NAD(P)-dependent dehydrogenase (short-subunit alcohol dehydrogenase family)
MQRVVITGGSSGLGAAIKAELEGKHQMTVVDWSLATGVDVRSSNSVSNAVEGLSWDNIDVLINCAGINGIEFLPDVTDTQFDDIMATNARAIFLTARACLPMLRGGTILNVVSNAAHVPMTSSLAYNMSKAAALMATKQLARELIKTHGITVFSVSPNKLKGTGMSDYIERRVCELRSWTPEEAQKYQMAALPAGVETDPKDAAELIGFLLAEKRRHAYLAGCDLTLGGPTI